MSKNCNIFIIAGESSGDLHGSFLMSSLKKINPNIKFDGIGGEMMENQGLKSLFPIEKLSVMGFTEIIKHLPFFLSVKKKVMTSVLRKEYKHIILIDYPGFNLNILPSLSMKTNADITYFICPQIWAWKEGRINLLKKYVKNKIVIFPFEKNWYKERNLDVFFPGHPIIDEWEPVNKSNFLKKHNLTLKNPIITLYPGSREQEFSKHFLLFLNSVRIVKQKIMDIQVILGCAKTINLEPYENLLPDWLKIEKEDPQSALEIADNAIIASGTSTLEAAVYGTPGVIVYRLSTLSWWLSKLFVKVRYAGMVNLIANEEIMPEFLQEKANPVNISNEILSLIQNKEKYKRKLDKLNEVKTSLGNKGVFKRIAFQILANN